MDEGRLSTSTRFRDSIRRNSIRRDTEQHLDTLPAFLTHLRDYFFGLNLKRKYVSRETVKVVNRAVEKDLFLFFFFFFYFASRAPRCSRNRSIRFAVLLVDSLTIRWHATFDARCRRGCRAGENSITATGY